MADTTEDIKEFMVEDLAAALDALEESDYGVRIEVGETTWPITGFTFDHANSYLILKW